MSILCSDWSIVVVNSIFSCDCTVRMVDTDPLGEVPYG